MLTLSHRKLLSSKAMVVNVAETPGGRRRGAMGDVTEWLESIGLSEYVQRFVENGIDLSVLGDLTEQDLKELGVLLGHRRKLLRAIAELDDAARPSLRKQLSNRCGRTKASDAI